MRFLIFLFVSLATALFVSDSNHALHARSLTSTLTKTVSSSAKNSHARDEKKVTPSAGQSNERPKQGAMGQVIAQKSRLLNPDIDNRVQKDLAKEAQKNEKKALKHADKTPDGGYKQSPLITEEKTLSGKPAYPKGQKIKDHLTAMNPFADPHKKASAKNRLLDNEYKKSPSDVEYEKKRNKLAGADNDRNKEYYDHCRNKKDEFDNKTKKLAMGLEIVHAAGALKPRDLTYLKEQIIHQHLVGREILRRQSCSLS